MIIFTSIMKQLAYKPFKLFFITTFALLVLLPAHGQKQMEQLDRGLVAVNMGSGKVFLSWRMFGTDPTSISFNVYRDNTKITNTPITTSTNYTDNSGSASATYYIRPVLNGVEQAASKTASVWAEQFLSIPIEQPAGGRTPDGLNYTYNANDCSVGDLDGDGQYEIILKWDPSNAKDNSQDGYTGNVYLDAYKLNGTRLWRIDLGKNIRAGAHYTQFMVYDFDGDGKAEVACKTADGTKDGKGIVIGDANADYRTSGGYILSGPEFLTVFNGETGAAMATANYLPARGKVSGWGDGYGNRVDRFTAAVAYLDGQRPSIIMGRGYYTRLVRVAWDWRDGKLTHRWTFDSNDSGNGAYYGQGNHQLTVGDVDGDGRDEICNGASAIDDDGTGLYANGLGHGDALHMSDMDPDRPGQEVWQCHEDPGSYGNYGLEFRDAKTGRPLWGIPGNGKDVGRAMAADIDPDYKGYECWGATGGLYSCTGTKISDSKPSMNFGVWWDGDLQRELLDGTKLDKWNSNTNSSNRLYTLYQHESATDNNGTKANPCLSGDILGDWREEVLLRSSDNKKLILFTTIIPTTYRLYTLMHDPQYRVAIAWQNTAYNQPPHPSFYLGGGMNTPPTPNIVLVGETGSTDCFGVENGTAYTDDCGVCVRGTTGRNPCKALLPGAYIIKPVHSGLCIQGNSSITQENCNESLNTQAWKVSLSGNNYLLQTIENNQYLSAPQTTSGANLSLNTDATNANWRLEDAGNGAYNIVPAANVDLTTDVNGNSTASGQNLLLYKRTGNTNQQFIFIPDTVSSDCNGVRGGTAFKDNCGMCVSGNTGKSACTSAIQGEDACFIEGITESINPGFIGTGYANSNNATDAEISWIVNASTAQAETLTFRYANGTANSRTAKVVLNGQTAIASLDFPTTGAWDIWQTVTITVPLNTGSNTLELVALTADGCANIDLIASSSSNVTQGSCLITGTNAQKAYSGMYCYPNPFSNKTFVKGHGNFSYTLTDIKGSILKKGNVENETSIGEDLKPGIYFIKLKSENESTFIKIIKSY